ncbi:MAG: hypothetical protein U1C46_04330 [Bacteroidales bacterium]|nr:hypothetical protein [Bacteroidales bacterium]
MTIFGVILFASAILSGCATTKESSIQRPIERHLSNWEVLGSVRVENLCAYEEIDLSIPYDQLLNKAHEKYGEIADVIEIKVEKQTLSIVEKAAIFKEQKKRYSARYIYNAVVIKYLPAENSTK